MAHQNDTVQIIFTPTPCYGPSRGLCLVERVRDGVTWLELPGGSYQFQRGCNPIEAAYKTLLHDTGWSIDRRRAGERATPQVLYANRWWNGLHPGRNQCAAARFIFVRMTVTGWRRRRDGAYPTRFVKSYELQALLARNDPPMDPPVLVAFALMQLAW